MRRKNNNQVIMFLRHQKRAGKNIQYTQSPVLGPAEKENRGREEGEEGSREREGKTEKERRVMKRKLEEGQ